MRDAEETNLIVGRSRSDESTAGRLRDGKLHVGLPGAEIDVADEHVGHAGGGAGPRADVERVWPAGARGRQRRGPVFRRIGARRHRSTGEGDGDVLGRRGGAPDLYRHVSLDHRVIFEERPQRQRRLRAGGCGHRARGGDGEQERSTEADEHDAPHHSPRHRSAFVRVAPVDVVRRPGTRARRRRRWGRTPSRRGCSKRPKRFSLSFTGSFISAKHSSMPASLQGLVEFREHVGGRDVDARDRLGRDDHPPHGRGRASHGLEHALVEQLRVGEEERRVPAEQHEPGNQPRLRIARDVVVAARRRRRGRAPPSADATRPRGTR